MFRRKETLTYFEYVQSVSIEFLPSTLNYSYYIENYQISKINNDIELTYTFSKNRIKKEKTLLSISIFLDNPKSVKIRKKIFFSKIGRDSVYKDEIN